MDLRQEMQSPETPWCDRCHEDRLRCVCPRCRWCYHAAMYHAPSGRCGQSLCPCKHYQGEEA